MMTKEAFKIGFLMRCAEEGLSPQETEQRIKQANAMTKEAVFGEAVGTAGKGLMNLVNSLKWGTLVIPPVTGAFGGYMLAKAKNDSFDIEEAKKDEELSEYYRAIDMLSRSERNRAAA